MPYTACVIIFLERVIISTPNFGTSTSELALERGNVGTFSRNFSGTRHFFKGFGCRYAENVVFMSR
eukprot:948796-Prorocentrum_minimum.AAC.2